jgi:hypothetical protein
MRCFETPDRHSVLAFCLTALGLSSTLQALPQIWADELSTARGSGLVAIDADGAGAFYLAGWSAQDALVQRRDVDGNVIWSRLLDSTEFEHATGVTVDGAAAVFVVGSTNGALGSAPSGDADAFVARYDSDGDLDWVAQFGSDDLDEALAVAVDGAGGVLVTGRTRGSLAGTASGDFDVWLARYDAAGVQVWALQFGSDAYDVVRTASPDGAGGVYLGGITDGDLGGSSGGGLDAWFARYDGAGNQLYLQLLGTAASEPGFVVTADGAGGAFVAGGYQVQLVSGAFEFGLLLMRIDGDGETLWSRRHSLSGFSYPLDIVLEDEGGFAVAGSTLGSIGGPISGLIDVFLMRFDALGDPTALLQLSGTGFDEGYGLVDDGHSGLIAVGLTEQGIFGPNSLPFDGWVARFSTCDFEGASNYCVGLPNSTGVGAAIDSAGTRYLSNNEFSLTVSGCPSDQIGIFLMGISQASTPFGDGVLCIGGSVLRLLPPIATGASGTGSLQLDFTDPLSPASQITAGSTWNFQFWYRDSAAGGAGFNLSNGLSATFCP